MDYVLRSSRRS